LEAADSELTEIGGPAAEDPAAGSSRAVVEDEAPADTLDPILTPAGAWPFELELQVIDGRGLSATDAVVYAAPIGLPLNHLGKTGADGTLRARWHGTTEIMELAWCVRYRGAMSVLFHEQLRSGANHRALLCVPGSARIVRRGQSMVFRLNTTLSVAASSSSSIGLAPPVVRGDAGEIGFRDPLRWGGPEKPLLARGGKPLRANTVTVSPTLNEAVIMLDIPVLQELEVAPAGATVRGVVLRPDGEPAGGVTVSVGPDDRRVSSIAETDGSGQYVLPDLVPGELFLYARGGRAGLATERIIAGSDDRIEWNPTLDPGLVTSGLLYDASAAPLPGWRVELSAYSPDGPWRSEAVTSEGGLFTIPNCPGSPMRMEVFSGRSRPLPVAVLEGVVPGEGQSFPIDLSAGGNTAVTITVLDRDGAPLKGAVVRLWQVASDRGLLFAKGSTDGRHRIDDIPPGQYLVEIGAARLGWRELGPLYLSGVGAPNELGTIHLPAPELDLGTLELRFDPPRPWDVGRLAWSAHRVGRPVVAHVLSIGADEDPFRSADVARLARGQGDSILLPPADYVLRLHHPEHGTRDFPVRIEPGATTVLRVRDEDDEGVIVELADPEGASDEER